MDAQKLLCVLCSSNVPAFIETLGKILVMGNIDKLMYILHSTIADDSTKFISLNDHARGNYREWDEFVLIIIF